MENLDEIIEAVLFALGNEVMVSELANVLKVGISDVNSALDKLACKYDGSDAIVFKRVNDSVCLCTNNKYYDYVSLFVESSKKQKLSNSCLEVLSIIAYNPKITKLEIEKIRGVNSDFAVNKLLECGLIEECGRLDKIGKPAIFKVSNDFYRNCDISSDDELPSIDGDLSEIRNNEEIKEVKE